MTEFGTGVHAFDLNAQAWEPHNLFPAIMVKVLESRASHPRLSLLLVEVVVGGVIETHTHAVETETALVMAGQGVLVWGDERHETPVALGGGVTILPGTPHSLRNAGDVPLQMLAIHSPGIR